MPTVNIPPAVRFGLYLLSAFGSVFVAYAFARGYIGDPETACWAGLVAVVNGIAAANTNLAPEDERGGIAVGTAIVIGFLAVILLALLGGFR